MKALKPKEKIRKKNDDESLLTNALIAQCTNKAKNLSRTTDSLVQNFSWHDVTNVVQLT